jgi:hypothetical protein
MDMIKRIVIKDTATFDSTGVESRLRDEYAPALERMNAN